MTVGVACHRSISAPDDSGRRMSSGLENEKSSFPRLHLQDREQPTPQTADCKEQQYKAAARVERAVGVSEGKSSRRHL